MTFRWDIEGLPFLWAPQPSPNDGPLPEILPFRLRLDELTGRLVQQSTPEVESALETAYGLGSMIAGRLDEVGIGRRYADDFLGYLDGNLDSLGGQRVLEIGSGTGYLLSRLAEKGADTVGIEPGDHSQDRFRGPNVRLIRDFFPSDQLKGPFDLVILYNVLEHISDFRGWFDEIASLLAPRGRLVLSVPACDEFIAEGDLSILVHEHFSYFTADSLSYTLSSGDFGRHQFESSGVGRSWYATAATGEASWSPDIGSLINQAQGFRNESLRNVARLAEFLARTRNASETVAIYVPIRAINAIVMSGAPTDHCRFFDDDSNLQGHYLPGAGIVIEARDALFSIPTDNVAIMSESFGRQIRDVLRPGLPSATKIYLLNELTT